MLASLFLLALAAPTANSPCVAHPDPAGNLVSVYGQILGPNHAVVPLALIQLKPNSGGPTLHDFSDRNGCFEILVKPGPFELQIEPSLDFEAMHKSIVVEANQTKPFDVLLGLPTYCPEDCGPTLQSPLKPLATQSDPQGFVPQFHTARICFVDQQGLPVDHIQFMLVRISVPNYRLVYISYGQPTPQGSSGLMYGCRDIPDVLGGSYQLSADATGFQHILQEIQVDSSDAQTIHMTLRPPLPPCPASVSDGLVSIHGRVTDVRGYPYGGAPYGAIVQLRSAVGTTPRYERAEAQGCFQFLAKPGSYTLSVGRGAFEPSSKKITAEAGKENNYDFAVEMMAGPPVIIREPGAQPDPLSLVCFTDQNGIPIGSVQFTLQSTKNPKRIFTDSKPSDYSDDDHPGGYWGCWILNEVPLGNYTVRATSSNYQPFQKNLKITQPEITIQLTPLPAPTQP